MASGAPNTSIRMTVHDRPSLSKSKGEVFHLSVPYRPCSSHLVLNFSGKRHCLPSSLWHRASGWRLCPCPRKKDREFPFLNTAFLERSHRPHYDVKALDSLLGFSSIGRKSVANFRLRISNLSTAIHLQGYSSGLLEMSMGSGATLVAGKNFPRRRATSASM